MEKIVIIGSSGAGKTTLALRLGLIHKFKVFHLDRMFWQDGWEKESRDTRIDTVQKLVMDKQWIIEGTYLNSSKIHLNAADTIIFLDIHPLLCLQRIIQRHFEYRGLPRRDIPEGCTDNLTPMRLLKVLAFPSRERRKLKHLLRNYGSKNIIELHSDKEVEDFLVQQSKLSGTVLTTRQKLPVMHGRMNRGTNYKTTNSRSKHRLMKA